MSDSEPDVNPISSTGVHCKRELDSIARANLSYVPSNRDTVLSDFVRMKIREWEASGREQQELARIAQEVAPQFGKSTVAQVKKGTGVGAKTAPGFARAFGFADVAAMVDAAHDWRRGSGSALDELMAEEPVRVAMENVKLIVSNTTDEQLRSILSAFTAARFRGRDAMFWVQTLGEEAKRDALQQVAANAAKGVERSARTAQIRTERGAWREAAELKSRLPEPTPPPVSPVQPAEEAAPKPRRRRRAAGG